jgi:RNA polymerase-binding transcription factor DksA
MAKSIKKAAKPMAKAAKKLKAPAKPAAKKAIPKPAPKKAVKVISSTKKIVKKMSVSTNNKTAKAPLKEKTLARKKNLAPLHLTANDNDIVANSKFRYSAKDLDMFRKVIMEQRAEASEEFDIISQQLMDTSGEFDGENQSFALHTAEQGSDAMEREKHFLQAQRTSDYIKKLDEAVERITRGTYGICVICGELIEKQRLFAVPITQKHVHCKNKTQRKTFSVSTSEAAYIPPEESVE